MNPNSGNQIWSKWEFTVTPERKHLPFRLVRDNCARFARKAFGSSSEMRLTHSTSWHIEIRTEGSPVHDPHFEAYMSANWRQFLSNGFGEKSHITIITKLEAGSRQDGSPSEQLIIVPPIEIPELMHG